ncbi:MAG: chemotaxis protein CheA, partial [Methylotenera sp.]
MPDAFDTGPLSWVKSEIDQSLKKVKQSFDAVAEKPEDFASLRFTETHLYQISGALDMVGLEGCKRFCSEIEKLTNKLEKQLIPVSDSVMADLTHAVDTLAQYLQDLLNGMPDMPTRLYSSLKPLVELQGESLEISDLFYPDTTYNAPKDLPTNQIEESFLPQYVANQRATFQKSLLDWLRTKNSNALESMRESILNVQQAQHKNAQKTLWWVATAFTETLAQAKIADQAGAKKLCRRLDHQLRNMAEGDAKAPSQLLRDALYYVALSDRNTDAIARVKDLFELDNTLPTSISNDASNSSSLVITAAELAALAQLNAELSKFKDLWSSISADDNEPLDAFIAKFENAAAIQQSLNNQYVHDLFNAIHTTAIALSTDSAKINETSLIEVAAALNLLEYVGVHYQQLDTDVNQKMIAQVARLQSLMQGETLLTISDNFAATKLDNTVVAAVAKQIIAALQLVEKALDTFFRNAGDVTILDETSKPLQQVSAAFDMLEMSVPKSIAQLSEAYTNHFRLHTGQLNNTQFELLAESLSMLSLYAEELPNTRVESETALEGALQRLEQGALSFNLVSEVNDIANKQAETEKTAEVSNNETIASQTITSDSKIKQPSLIVADQPSVDEVKDRAIDVELEDIFLTETEEVLAHLAQHLQSLRVNS